MIIRFQADADLNQAIVDATTRREPGLDFQTAQDADLEGVQDPEVLARAAREGRILVSHDAKTMPRHFGDYITHSTSPGVFIVPQHLPVRVAAEELLLIWSATEASEWVNRICRLPL